MKRASKIMRTSNRFNPDSAVKAKERRGNRLLNSYTIKLWSVVALLGITARYQLLYVPKLSQRHNFSLRLRQEEVQAKADVEKLKKLRNASSLRQEEVQAKADTEKVPTLRNASNLLQEGARRGEARRGGRAQSGATGYIPYWNCYRYRYRYHTTPTWSPGRSCQRSF